MAFFTILGNINAVISFAQTAASAIAGNSPTREAANTIFGTDTGGNGGQSLSVTALTAELEEKLQGVNDFTFDLSTQGSLAESEVALTNVADFLNGGSAVDRSTVVNQAQSGLRNVINAAEVARDSGSDANIAAATGAVTAALNARLVVVETLEDGALGRDGIRSEIEAAIAELDLLVGRVRDALPPSVDGVKPEDVPDLNPVSVPGIDYVITGGRFFVRDYVVSGLGLPEEGEIGFVTKARGEEIVQSVFSRLDGVRDPTGGPDDPLILRMVIADENGPTTIRIAEEWRDPDDERVTFDFGTDGADAALKAWIVEEIAEEVRAELGWGREGTDLADGTDVYGGLLEDVTNLTPDAPGGADNINARQGALALYDPENLPQDGLDRVRVETTDPESLLRYYAEVKAIDDFVNTGAGDDTVKASAGDDVILAGSGADVVEGGLGVDIIRLGNGDPLNDYATGFDAFTDRVVFRERDATDIIHNFKGGPLADGGDVIVLDGGFFSALGPTVTADELFEGSFADGGYGDAHLIRDGQNLYYDPDGSDGADPGSQLARLVSEQRLIAENFEIAAPAADLEVSYIDVPYPVDPGETAEIRLNVTNKGTAVSAPFTVEARLSPDDDISHADPVVGSVELGRIPAGVPAFAVLPFTVPTGGFDGDPMFWIGLEADVSDAVPETDEANNLPSRETIDTGITVIYAGVPTSDGDDTVRGTSADDTLSGGAGDDLLFSGANPHHLDGGDGTDTASYAGFASSVTVRLSDGTGEGGDAEGDTFESIENLIGSPADDTLVGANGVDNVLEGGEGGDLLVGLGGRDTATYHRSDAAVTVNLQTGTGEGGEAEGDSLEGIENLIGSHFADTLIGVNGVDNRFEGGAGNDTLIGGDGQDTAIYSGARGDYDIAPDDAGNLIVTDQRGGADGTDTLRQIQTLQFSDGTVDTGDFITDVTLTGQVTDMGGAALAGADLAVLDAGGAALDSLTSDAAGRFSTTLPDSEAARLDASRDYDPETDPAISALDALDVLRLAVGLAPSFGTAQAQNYITADINADNAVTALDALEVLRAAVGLDSAHAPRWAFFDAATDWDGVAASRAAVNAPDTGIDLSTVAPGAELEMTGILLGNMESV